MGHVLQEPLQLVTLPGNNFCKASVVAKSLLVNTAEQAFEVSTGHNTSNAAQVTLHSASSASQNYTLYAR
jgi:hypothetical protein